MALYRHLKRQTIYESLDEAGFLHEFSSEGDIITLWFGNEQLKVEFQYSGGAVSKSRYAGPVVLYKGTDNKHWMRPLFEFHDGRFEKL